MQNTIARYSYLSILTLLLSFQFTLKAQELPTTWEMEVSPQSLETIKESLNNRLRFRGTRVLGARIGEGFFGLVHSFATLSSVFFMASSGVVTPELVTVTGINSVIGYRLVKDMLYAKKNFDERTLRKILLEAKKNEAAVVASIKVDLMEQGIELLGYKNHTVGNMTRFFKHGDARITLTVKGANSKTPVEIELKPEITFAKKEININPSVTILKNKIQIGNDINIIRESNNIESFKFIASISSKSTLNQKALIDMGYVESIVSKMKLLNTCNYLIL